MTIAETGLPGRPRTSTPLRAPNHVGLPGCSATRQKRCSTPSRASAGLTWSCGPTETPPETTTRSAAASASSSAAAVAARAVGHRLAGHDLTAGAGDQRAEGQRVGVIQLAGAQRPAGRDQLVPGRQHRDARAAGAAQRGATGGCGDADRRGTELRSGSEHAVPGGHVLARRANVLAGRGGGVEVDVTVVLSGVLDAGDGGRAGRHGRAGADADCLSLLHGGARGVSGARLVDDPQPAAGLARHDREAVHGRAGVGRHVARGDDVLGERAAEGGRELELLVSSARHSSTTSSRARATDSS